jgi:hypothetical protein
LRGATTPPIKPFDANDALNPVVLVVDEWNSRPARDNAFGLLVFVGAKAISTKCINGRAIFPGRVGFSF